MKEEKHLINELIDYKKKYDEIRDQTDLVIEEMAELTKEITKHFRNKQTDSSILEEACDVILTSYTLLRLLGHNDAEIISEIQYKARRTIAEYHKIYILDNKTE